MMKRTEARVKNDRLTIFAKDARVASVTTLPMDQAAAGNFELSVQDNGDTLLLFKAAGKKTGETIATYAKNEQATRALETVYGALGRKSGFFGVVGGAAKIIGLIILGIMVFLFLVIWIMGAIFGGEAEQGNGDGAVTEQVTEETTLPVGEPFPVSDFIEKTQSQESQEQ